MVSAQNIFKVQETDLVKLKTEAVDPDNDKITYTYGHPLDKNGEWQTGYNDSGTYHINISASDGKSTSSQIIELIVENKNQLPYLTENKITVKEGQVIDLKTLVKDEDNDILKFKFERPFDKSGIWKTGFNDAGYYTTNVTINDGTDETSSLVEINVLPTNQYPIIKKIFSNDKNINLKENETFNYSIEAEDPEKEPLKYQWTLDKRLISEEPKGDYTFNMNSSGHHQLQLTIKDSSTITNKEWNLEVANVNQKPKINIAPISVKEGDKIKLELPQKDIDGDTIKYTYQSPLDSQGQWQTNYQSAGDYILNITSFDGESTVVNKVEITINNVDLPPSFTLPSKFYLKEGEEFNWKIDLLDADNESLDVTFNNTPANSYFDSQKKIFSWTPSYNTIERKEGLLSNILNSLRLEKYFLRSKTQMLGIKACGKELCRKGITELVIENKDQKPIITQIRSNLPSSSQVFSQVLTQPETKTTINTSKKNETIQDKNTPIAHLPAENLLLTQFILTEGEKLQLTVTAADPDNDIVRYTFAAPFNKNGLWQTTEGDKGEYSSAITASDGTLEDTIPIKIKVVAKNKQPTLNIKEDEYTINEMDQLSFSVTASDQSNDSLNLWLDNPPVGASFKDGIFTWQPNYNLVQNKTDNWWHNLVSSSSFWNKKLNDEKTIVWLKFTASDGQYNISHPVKITIKNINQAPKITSITPNDDISVRVNEPIIFQANAIDPDNDPLKYEWSFSLHESNIRGTNTIERTFIEPGDKKVTLTISDGRDSTKQEWKVHVLSEEYQEPNPKTESLSTETTSSNPTFRVYIVDQKK